MTDEYEPQRVAISPITLLQRSMDLMGDQYLLLVAITLIGFIIGGAVPIILMGPMFCGIYLCFFQRAQGGQASFETLFRGFDYFMESLIATILASAAQVVIMLLAYLIVVAGIFGVFAGGGGSASVLSGVIIAVAYLLLLILSFLVPALFMFVMPLIVDKKLTAIPAIQLSLKAVMANLGGVLLMSIAYGVISFAATCLCFVPVLFFTPIALGATFVLYQDIFYGQQKPVA